MRRFRPGRSGREIRADQVAKIPRPRPLSKAGSRPSRPVAKDPPARNQQPVLIGLPLSSRRTLPIQATLPEGRPSARTRASCRESTRVRALQSTVHPATSTEATGILTLPVPARPMPVLTLFRNFP